MPFIIFCAMSHKMPIIFPMMSTTVHHLHILEHTHPFACLLNHFSRPSVTADHNVGDKPSCGNLCLVVTVMYVCVHC